MPSANRVPDETILQLVTERLSRSAIGSGKLMAKVSNGCVTLCGVLHYEMQRRPAVNAARGVEGVSNVVDRLQVKPPGKNRL